MNQQLATTNGNTPNHSAMLGHIAKHETSSVAVAAQAKALVEARYVMAMQRPRDMDSVRQQMIKECKRPGFAEVARYVKPIGKDKNKWPAGPSIRFAEAAIRIMRNITVEDIVVYDDREKRIVRVMVTDLEANVPYSRDITVAKTIERRNAKPGDVVVSTRTNSYGDTVFILEATDEDIENKQAAMVSKVLRTLGLRLVPGDLVEECMTQVLDTQKRSDATDPDAAKRKLLDSFAGIGVTAGQIKEYLGHAGETLTPIELTELRSLFAAIRDGESTWRDAMDSKNGDGEGEKPASSLSEKLKGKAAANEPKQEQKPATTETDSDL